MILSGAGPTLTQYRNLLFVLFAMPRMIISTTTMAKLNLRSGARSVVTCSKPNRDSVKTINQNTSAPTATTLSFDGRSEKRSRSISVLMTTVSTASRPLRNSIPMNGNYRKNEVPNSNSAISIGSTITSPRSFCTQNLKNRSSRLRRSTTPRTSLA